MVSPKPWRLDEDDPSKIYDAEGNMIAEDYRFLHIDDFEDICRLRKLRNPHRRRYDRDRKA